MDKVKFNQERKPLRPIIEDADLDENTFSHFTALMEKCWAENPDERPHVRTVLRTLQKIGGGK